MATETLKLRIQTEAEGTDSLNKVTSGLEKINKESGNTQKGVNKADASIKELSTTFASLNGSATGIIELFRKAGVQFSEIKRETGSTKDAFKAMAGSMLGAGGIMLGVTLVTQAIEGLISLFGTSQQKIAELSAAYQGTSEKLKSAQQAQEAYNTSIKSGNAQYIGAQGALKTYLDQLKDVQAFQAKELIKTFEKTGIEYFQKLPTSIKTSVDALKLFGWQSSVAVNALIDLANRGQFKQLLAQDEFRSLIMQYKEAGTELKFLDFIQRIGGQNAVDAVNSNIVAYSKLSNQFETAKKGLEAINKTQTPTFKTGRVDNTDKIRDAYINSFQEVAVQYEMLGAQIEESPGIFDKMAESFNNFTNNLLVRRPEIEAEMSALQSIGDSTRYVLEGTFGGVRSGMEDAMTAVITGQGSFGEAIKKMTQQAVLSLAVRSGVEAIFQGAMALGSLAIGDVKGAALHGKSAVMFAGVAVAAGVASKAIGTGIGGGGSGGEKQGVAGGGGTEIQSRQTVNIYGDVDKSSIERMKRQNTLMADQLREALVTAGS